MGTFLTSFRQAFRRTDTTRTQAESLAVTDPPTTSTIFTRPDDDLDEAEQAALAEETRIGFLLGDAGSAALNADHAAAYGGLHAGYDQARQDQADARAILPTMPAAVQEKVADLEERQARPVTLPELRWLEHQASNGESVTVATDQAVTHEDQAAEASGNEDSRDPDLYDGLVDADGYLDEDADWLSPKTTLEFYGNWALDDAALADRIARANALAQFLAELPEPPTVGTGHDADVVVDVDEDGDPV